MQIQRQKTKKANFMPHNVNIEFDLQVGHDKDKKKHDRN